MADKKTNRKPAAARGGRKHNTGATAKGKRDASKEQEVRRINPYIKTEAVIIAVFAVSILVAFSVFSENAGAFGSFINKVLFGLFGAGALILPFAVMLGCVFAGFKKFKSSSRLKNGLVCVLFLAFISIVHIMSLGKASPGASGIGEYISYYAENGASGNGGVIGAVIGGALIKIIGRTGAYLFLGAAVVICLVVITERSIFELLSSAASKTMVTAKRINTDRKRRLEARPRAVSASDESFEALKGRISRNSKNYNHELNWDEKEDTRIDVSYPTGAVTGEDIEIPDVITMFGMNEPRPDNKKEQTTGSEKEQTVEVDSENIIVNEEIDIKDGFEDGINDGTKNTIKDEEQFNETQEAYGENIVIENYDSLQAEEAVDIPPFDVDKSGGAGHSCEADKLHTSAGEKAVKAAGFNNRGALPSAAEIKSQPQRAVSNEFIDYKYPPIDLLYKGENSVGRDTKSLMLKNAHKLEETLKSFGVIAKVVQINKGPTVTRYELTPDSGVKVSKIVNLADDIALNLASDGIRIEAPVPGKSVVGIEVPNRDRTPVFLRDVLESQEFQNFESKVAFGVGKDIGGNAIVADVSDMPHLLIAGATGAGKSVCINTLITSILYKASPNEVKLILIDPKVVELGIYDGIPHLLTPVVTSPKEAASALNWGVHEMNTRYNLFKEENVRDLKGYNSSMAEKFEFESILPKIVIIIDELSDLMMSAPKDVEDSIMRLAQKARAAGIHLVLATQRPSVDVITGVIKANIPSRLAFAVSSGTDSRTILDMVGAEKLLGRGDMLFSPRDLAKPKRIQGAFISDKEVESVVDYIKQYAEVEYDENIVAEITTAVKPAQAGAVEEGADELYEDVLEFVLTKKEVSVSMLQRQFRVGYNRSARLVDALEKNGVVGPADISSKSGRKVLANNYDGE